MRFGLLVFDIRPNCIIIGKIHLRRWASQPRGVEPFQIESERNFGGIGVALLLTLTPLRIQGRIVVALLRDPHLGLICHLS